MPAILICGDTLRSPELRHEVPLGIGDPFLYLETDGRRAVLTNVLEVDRIAAGGAGARAPARRAVRPRRADRRKGCRTSRSIASCTSAPCASSGSPRPSVPPDFPLAVADRLRAEGIELTPDDELFVERRRRKTDAELAGIRRAAHAAVAGVEECARVLREAEIDGDGLRYEGEVLTSELLRARIREVCARLGAPAPDDIIVAPMRPGDAVGHEAGSGPLPAHAPICLDLWPQDEASGCWADMTRTWVRGDISDAVADLHRLVLEAHERSLAATRPGVLGVDVYGAACDVFEAAGHPTQRTKKPGETLQHGFFFGLGHGVGLEVHEAPALGRTGRAPLIAGDVVADRAGHGRSRARRDARRGPGARHRRRLRAAHRTVVRSRAIGGAVADARAGYAEPVIEPEPWEEDPQLDALLGEQGAARFRAMFDGFPDGVGLLWAIRDDGGRDRRLRVRLRQPDDHAHVRAAARAARALHAARGAAGHARQRRVRRLRARVRRRARR